MTAGIGTTKWLAPEVIAGSSGYGPAADIFSFSVVLFELDRHRLPYEDARDPNGDAFADVAVLAQVSTGDLRPSFLPTCRGSSVPGASTRGPPDFSPDRVLVANFEKEEFWAVAEPVKLHLQT